MIYVIGHKNPDMDSIAAASGYAWLRRNRDGDDAVAARAGQLNAQARFALDRFGVAAPTLVEDASPRFIAVATKPSTVGPETPLAQACQLYIEHGHPVPVVDTDGCAMGLVTGQQTFKYLMRNFDSSDATMHQILDVPSIEAADRDVPAFIATERIRDQHDALVRTRREFFLVTDDDGHYVGMCTRADMLQPPRMNLILVDHNEASQAVSGLAEAELIEVIDHHRIGSFHTTLPISFHVDVVGSCSTLVAERMRLGRVTPPAGIAGLLMSGVLSDTLIFRSPTTTPRDRAAALWLAWAAFGMDDAEPKMSDYGQELLRSGAEVTGRSAQDMCSADFKEFNTDKLKFGVAQVEVTNFAEIMDRMPEIRDELRAVQGRRGLAFTALLITDVVMNNSLLAFGDETRLLGGLPYARLKPGVFDLPGVVSRKKQLLPAMLALLQG